MAKMGRPTKYNEELQAKADYYVENHREFDDLVPSMAGLCCMLKISRGLAFVWRDQHPDFAETLEDINARQHKMLITGGLSSNMNPTITKLMMSNHGYSEKQAVEHSGVMVNHNTNAEVSKEDIDDFLGKL